MAQLQFAADAKKLDILIILYEEFLELLAPVFR